VLTPIVMLVAPTSTLLADEFPVVVLLGGVNAGIALDRTSTDNSKSRQPCIPAALGVDMPKNMIPTEIA
jgi:hypothetical protein